jgi:UDP-N-acetylglucosamine 2-epimerase (non-hydrolysing)/GDP/UDP-N,N'-diacetylbacillosamine 2-epimerase (hydrolysing)
MSHLHFACTRRAAKRIAAMGEEPWRITFSGSLSLDQLRRERLMSKAQVEKKLGIRLSRDAILCIQHPVTLMRDTIAESGELFAALAALKQQVFFIYPNADAGSRELVRRAEAFVRERSNSRIFVNLDHRTYLGLMSNVGVLVGNSSSGIIESTSLEVAAVNVGIRQRGREHAANVIDAPARRKDILRAIERTLSPQFKKSCRGLESPYGGGDASRIVAKTLAQVPLGDKLLFKNPDLL